MFNLENLLFVSSATIRPFAFLISFLYILQQLQASGYYLFRVQKPKKIVKVNPFQKVYFVNKKLNKRKYHKIINLYCQFFPIFFTFQICTKGQ